MWKIHGFNMIYLQMVSFHGIPLYFNILITVSFFWIQAQRPFQGKDEFCMTSFHPSGGSCILRPGAVLCAGKQKSAGKVSGLSLKHVSSWQFMAVHDIKFLDQFVDVAIKMSEINAKLVEIEG